MYKGKFDYQVHTIWLLHCIQVYTSIHHILLLWVDKLYRAKGQWQTHIGSYMFKMSKAKLIHLLLLTIQTATELTIVALTLMSDDWKQLQNWKHIINIEAELKWFFVFLKKQKHEPTMPPLGISNNPNSNHVIDESKFHAT